MIRYNTYFDGLAMGLVLAHFQPTFIAQEDQDFIINKGGLFEEYPKGMALALSVANRRRNGIQTRFRWAHEAKLQYIFTSVRNCER